jgi:hypothetical protein
MLGPSGNPRMDSMVGILKVLDTLGALVPRVNYFLDGAVMNEGAGNHGYVERTF